ncbi:hypothetical protein D9M71_435360 [compost metagenome]
MRSCLKNTGPGLSSLIARATASSTGDANSRIRAARTLSSRFFRNRLVPVNGVSDKVSTGMPEISRTL